MAISGYKGIAELIEVPARDFNVIVGKNDAGKSTILKALDMFLNNKQYITENLNNQTARYTEIHLFFSPNSTGIVIDENIETTFENEDLLDENGLLHIYKRWDGVKEGKITPEYFLFRKHYKEMDFFSLTENQLIKLCQVNDLEAALGLMTNPDTGEEHNNAEKRMRLKEIYSERDVGFEYIPEKLPTTGQSRLKKTEQALKKCLPQFEYFLADSPLSESDSAIQKYFKEMAYGIISKEVDTESLENTVRGELQRVLDAVTSKINSVVPESEHVKARIDFDWSKLISTSFESDGESGALPLSSRGDGFRRITMMSYFEYLAEERRSNHQNVIFAFEEPETFLHPSAQEMLFDKLSDISKVGYQVFLTTHSPVLVSKSQKSDLQHVFKEDGNYLLNPIVQNYRQISDDLGITVDNQFISLFDSAKCLLLVEGIDDCKAFNYLSRKYKDNGITESTFEDLGIVAVPVGGCGSIKHWVSLDLLSTLNKPYYIVLDSDRTSQTGESPNAVKLIEYGLIEGETFSVTRKRELENYINPVALNRLVPGCDVVYTDWCDVKSIVKQHPMSAALGGKRIANKHFESLNMSEILMAFNPDSQNDEFREIYDKVAAKVEEANV
jgi:putative ATP-dependent endonuclease of OLD family